MHRSTILLIILALLLGACNEGSQSTLESGTLTITDGTTEVTYTSENLQGLSLNEAAFGDITYVGVKLKGLLENAGFVTADIKAVKAVASDGYSANYDASIFLRDDVIVAYATADGPLSTDDGQFRMVVPGEAGKLNVRMLVTLQVIP